MKKTSSNKAKPVLDEMRAEYHFDYSKAKPNRFAHATQPSSATIVLDPDIAKVFKSSEAVNAVLRVLIETMPRAARLTKPDTSKGR